MKEDQFKEVKDEYKRLIKKKMELLMKYRSLK